ncbi:MAG: 23S rRNA (uracil(1939)-C(5))-methyltransferase RlmD [Planctomycetota bacterium]
MNERKPRRGDLLEVTLERLDDRGWTVGTSGPYSVRVRGGVVGDRVRVDVAKRRRNAIDARIDEVLEAGPARVEPRCRHHASCGGCRYQRTRYADQLVALERGFRETLGGAWECLPIVGAKEPWNYRNKMDFTFGARRWIEPHEPAGIDDAGPALGLHAPGRFDKVLDIDECHIAFHGAAEIVRTVRREAKERGLEAWNVRTHEGLLRHVVLRAGFRTGDRMLNLVTTERAPERIEPLVAALAERHPEVTTIVQNVTDRLSLVAYGEEEFVHRGPGTILERLCGLEFTISANSFFQTNTEQAERLFTAALDAAGIESGDLVFDLYCGAGSLSLAAARRGARVRGFELVPEAIADAEANARANDVSNATFVAGDLAETLPAALAEGGEAPRIALVDPPRAGMHERVVRALAELAPERIVYVSCNPKTAARDAALLVGAGYRPLTAEPFDLFPHTPHLECVLVLERVGLGVQPMASASTPATLQ